MEAQANITCRLLSLYLDGDTAIAEWLAEFDDSPRGAQADAGDRGAPLRGEQDRQSLREYWASETVEATVSVGAASGGHAV